MSTFQKNISNINMRFNMKKKSNMTFKTEKYAIKFWDLS